MKTRYSFGGDEPHQPARFVKVDIDTALEARAEEKARMGRLRQSLA